MSLAVVSAPLQAVELAQQDEPVADQLNAKLPQVLLREHFQEVAAHAVLCKSVRVLAQPERLQPLAHTF